jgi:hypothetical protein
MEEKLFIEIEAKALTSSGHKEVVVRTGSGWSRAQANGPDALKMVDKNCDIRAFFGMVRRMDSVRVLAVS